MTQVTIGRRLYVFFSADVYAAQFGFKLIDPLAPCDAGVLYVHADGTLNLLVTDHCGNTKTLHNITLVEDNKDTAWHVWAEWMPYQKAMEAAKVQGDPK